MLRFAKCSPRLALLAGGGVLLGLVTVASGQGPKSGVVAPPSSTPVDAPKLLNPDRGPDEAAIRATDAEFARAFNAADLTALVASFTDDGQIIDEHGEVSSGRNAIRERFVRSFANNPGASLALEPRSLRFIGPETALERGLATLRQADTSAPAEINPYTVVYVKRGGKWLQASVEDHAPAPEAATASNADRLKDLAWLLGEWVNESADAVVTTSCRWDESKTYLLQDYTIKVAGKPVLRGSQRIGWDPARKQVRSWSFDTDGGFADGFWSRDKEGRWVIHASGTRHDGRAVEGTRVITPIDKHRIRWESVHRAIDGQARPDVDSYIMVRKPPAPAPPGPKPKAATNPGF